MPQVEENLKSSVQEVRSLTMTRDELQEQTRNQERSLSEVNYKLSQEVAAKNLAEEKLVAFRDAVEEAKRKKVRCLLIK